MAEKRGITPLGDKQEEERTSGHKKNLEKAENSEDITGFGAHGLLLLAHSFISLAGFGFCMRKSHAVQAGCSGLNEMPP